MTYAQKIQDERRFAFDEGRAEGRAETLKDAVLAMKDLADPTVIAQRLKLSLEQVLKILEQS